MARKSNPLQEIFSGTPGNPPGIRLSEYGRPSDGPTGLDALYGSRN